MKLLPSVAAKSKSDFATSVAEIVRVLAVDTACSSSLVGTHMACLSMTEGACSSAATAGMHCSFSMQTLCSVIFAKFLLQYMDAVCMCWMQKSVHISDTIFQSLLRNGSLPSCLHVSYPVVRHTVTQSNAISVDSWGQLNVEWPSSPDSPLQQNLQQKQLTKRMKQSSDSTAARSFTPGVTPNCNAQV